MNTRHQNGNVTTKPSLKFKRIYKMARFNSCRYARRLRSIKLEPRYAARFKAICENSVSLNGEAMSSSVRSGRLAKAKTPAEIERESRLAFAKNVKLSYHK